MDLTLELGKVGFVAEKVDDAASLANYDHILYDIETAYFDGSLEYLIPHVDRLLPSPTNEIIKRKNFLALMYSFATGAISIPTNVSQQDREHIENLLVPTSLIPDQIVGVPLAGAIKDVIGIWGLQVTILSPTTTTSKGHSAKKRRKTFRAHLTKATESRNAVLQEYISPIEIPGHPRTFTEFSLVFTRTAGFPYARIYEGTPERRKGVGDGLVRIEQD